jgi:outer membrane protein OmpA-like peptidoglycan-associated protein
MSAGSGAAGTFRVHLLIDWFQTSSFLCFDSAPCIPTAAGQKASDPDSATHFGANVGLSVTPLPFLEAYATIRSESNGNDRGRPELLQVLGDTSIGAKVFTPNKLGQLFNFGGAADVLFLNGAGTVGLDGGSTSFKLNGLATLDLRQPNDGGAPLRMHLNLGYLFDNSASMIQGIEDRRKAVKDVRGNSITRIERYGLAINRVDQFLISFGVEGMFPVIRPFAEYHLGIGSNRQGYECDPSGKLGDQCLANADFSYMPSTLTLGLRAYPFLKGLEAMAAFDIGTSGTSAFIAELAPTPQWDLWLGAGFSFDAVEPPPPKPQIVERLVGSPPPPQRFIRGFVHEKDKTDPIVNAIVHFDGRDLTGLVSGGDGRFVSSNVDPGSYTLSIKADGYKDAQCNAVVNAAGPAPAPVAPAPAPAAPGAPPGAPAAPGAPPVPAPPPPAPALGGSTGPSYFDVDCPLEALPKTGSVSGNALDADTNSPVNGVAVRVVDVQGKELAISTDANGGFHMEGLQPGTITIKADADGYMLHVQTAEIRLKEDTRADLKLNKRPKKGDVEIAGNEIKIKKQIHFETDSAKISLDSTGLLEEIADTLTRNACLKQVEIQGHTDNTGPKEHNKTLSNDRANAVREWLLGHGVEPGRLLAMGYGQERPISPNVTPAGKERNRRVQFMIKDQDKGCGGKAGGTSAGADKPAKPAGDTKPAGEKKPKPALPF